MLLFILSPICYGRFRDAVLSVDRCSCGLDISDKVLANYEDRELARLKAPPENDVDEYQELGLIETFLLAEGSAVAKERFVVVYLLPAGVY